MFRFVIRDVLWLTVVVALAIGRWLSSAAWKSREAEWRERAKQSDQELAFSKTVQQAYWDKYEQAVRELVSADAASTDNRS